MEANPLAGQCAIVTGGARRIGRSIALAFAASGADVAITYRKSTQEAQNTADEIVSMGRRAFAVECDVRSETSVVQAIQTITDEFGRIDVLVNNAGVFTSAPLDELSVEAWDEAFETNTRGPFLVTRAALPNLRKVQGRVINIGSLGGMHAWANHAHYCASKAALHMLTQAMAKSFAPEVSVNCVAPGWIDMGAAPHDVEARFAAKSPMKRNGAAEEVAEAVLFFATGPRFITGQILAVDGGLGLV
jgi:3-oxoacyl-[acyl-carrier protein] reductase/pteridine reductase